MACPHPSPIRHNRSDFSWVANQDQRTVDQVDVRGPRFAAWVTTAVLVVDAARLQLSPAAAAVILGLQAVVFAIGALGGPRKHPYGLIFASSSPRGSARSPRRSRCRR